jgi:hypothetical protein
VFPVYDRLEGAENTRVQKLSTILAEVVNSFEGLKWLAVGALGCQGVEGVRSRQDPAAERNLFFPKPRGIPTPVPLFVMVLQIAERRPDVKKRGKNIGTNSHMILDVLELFAGERLGFVEYSLPDSNYSYVVKAAGKPDILTCFFIQSQLLRYETCHLGNPL